MFPNSHVGRALLLAIPMCLLLALLTATVAVLRQSSSAARLLACAAGGLLCLLSAALFFVSPAEIQLPDWLTIGDQLQVSLSLRSTASSSVLLCVISLSLCAAVCLPEDQWSACPGVDYGQADSAVVCLGMLLAVAGAVMSVLVADLFAWLLFWGLARGGAGLALWGLGAQRLIRRFAVLGGMADGLICWALLLLWKDLGVTRQTTALDPQLLLQFAQADPSVLSAMTMVLLGLYVAAAVVSGQFPFALRVCCSGRVPVIGRVLIWGVLAPSCLLVILRHAGLLHTFPVASSSVRQLMLVLGGWTALLAAANAVLRLSWERTMSYLAVSMVGIVFVGASLGTPRSVAAASLLLVTQTPLITGCFLWAGPRSCAGERRASRSSARWICVAAGVLLFSGCAGQQAIIGELLGGSISRTFPAPLAPRLVSGMLVLQLALAAAAMTGLVWPGPSSAFRSSPIRGGWLAEPSGLLWPLVFLIVAVLFACGMHGPEMAGLESRRAWARGALAVNLSGFAAVLGVILSGMICSRHGPQRDKPHPHWGSALLSEHFHVERVLGSFAQSCGHGLLHCAGWVDEFVMSRLPMQIARRVADVVTRMRATGSAGTYQMDVLGVLWAAAVLLTVVVWLLD